MTACSSPGRGFARVAGLPTLLAAPVMLPAWPFPTLFRPRAAWNGLSPPSVRCLAYFLRLTQAGMRVRARIVVLR